MIDASSTLTESLCGIFVKKVVEGSVADVQGRILPNDQVIEVMVTILAIGCPLLIIFHIFLHKLLCIV